MKCTKLLCCFLILYSIHTKADFQSGGDAYKQGDFNTAAKEFTVLAERGDHRAMYALGSMYAAGQGVDKNLEKAFSLFKEAALNGRIDAMYKLGLMYDEGQGVKQNYKKALRYYQKSAKGGYPLSQYRFGLMYADGKGVKKNRIIAYAWLIIAAHYFIYQSGKVSESSANANDFQSKILFTQQQEMNRITHSIVNELEKIRKTLDNNDIADIRKKVADYTQYKKGYHHISVKNILPNGTIDKLFLPDTLY